MKTKKLLRRVGEVLSGEARKKDRKKSALEHLLKRLEAKEQQLQQRLAAATDPDAAAKLRCKIQLLQAQRKKGEAVLDSGE